MNLFLNDFSLEIRKRNPSNLGTTACWFFFNCALTSSWKTSWFYFMLKLLYLFVIGWKGQRFYLLTIELKILLRSFPFCIWVCTLDLSLFHFIICFLFTCLLFVYSRISCCRRFGNLYFLKNYTFHKERWNLETINQHFKSSHCLHKDKDSVWRVDVHILCMQDVCHKRWRNTTNWILWYSCIFFYLLHSCGLSSYETNVYSCLDPVNIVQSPNALFLTLSAAQGSADDVAEYYQQQLEMLEGFTEMDTLTDRGFLPGMSKVCCVLFHWSMNTGKDKTLPCR